MIAETEIRFIEDQGIGKLIEEFFDGLNGKLVMNYYNVEDMVVDAKPQGTIILLHQDD